MYSFFRVLKYLSIGALLYGYPALLMLWGTWTDSQNSVKAFKVYRLPWSLYRIRPPFAGCRESNAFSDVQIAKPLVKCLFVMLAVMEDYDGAVITYFLVLQKQVGEIRTPLLFWLVRIEILLEPVLKYLMRLPRLCTRFF